MEKEKVSFNYEDFKNQAISEMRTGKSLVGKEGTFTPLIKEFLEAVFQALRHEHKQRGKTWLIHYFVLNCFKRMFKM